MANTETPSLPTHADDEIAVKVGECISLLQDLARAGAYAYLDQLSGSITRRHLPDAVRVAREYGTPWVEIGRELGTSKQAAQQRFSA
jgi:hypothetical protein